MTSQNEPEVIGDAAKATQAEKRMTLWQGLKTYPHAVTWSVFVSTAIIMVAFGQILTPSLLGVPAFKKKFGQILEDGSYEISPSWQTGLIKANMVGEIFGLVINGYITDRFGYKKTVLGALAFNIPCILFVYLSESIGVLLASQLVIGIPWGVLETLTTTYASDICPVPLRPYLTTYVNLCWVIGQLLALGVLRGLLFRQDQWAYKLPFALQWIWPVPLMIGVAYAPESPWWLVRKDRREEAKKMLLRITTNQPDFDADDTIAMMIQTNEIEKAISAGTSYSDCFRGFDLRRTEIACCVWAVQIVCGALMFYSAYFYVEAGLDESDAYSLALALWAIGGIGTMCSWTLLNFFGRRTIYLIGQAAMCVLFLIIGCIPGRTSAEHWAIGAVFLVFSFVYGISVGPVCYSLVCELTSTRLRTKTVVLARTLFHLIGLVAAVLIPRQINPTGWDWGSRAGFFWAGAIFIGLVWTFYRLPEPKGRTYGEIDILFTRKVSARKFKTTEIDASEIEQHAAVVQHAETFPDSPTTEREEKV